MLIKGDSLPSTAKQGEHIRVLLKTEQSWTFSGTSREDHPAGIKVPPEQQHLVSLGLRSGGECLPCLQAGSPQTPSSCCPRGSAPGGWCCLKEMSSAPEKVLRNLSPRISWLWGVIKACLLRLFLALKNLVVVPGWAEHWSLRWSQQCLLWMPCPAALGWDLQGPGQLGN